LPRALCILRHGAADLKQLLPLEAVGAAELLEAFEGIFADVYRLLLVALLVEQNEHRTVMGHKVDAHPNIGVSIASAKDEPTHLRQLIQASA